MRARFQKSYALAHRIKMHGGSALTVSIDTAKEILLQAKRVECWRNLDLLTGLELFIAMVGGSSAPSLRTVNQAHLSA